MLARDKTNHRTGEQISERVCLVTCLPAEQASMAELAHLLAGNQGIAKAMRAAGGDPQIARDLIGR